MFGLAIQFHKTKTNNDFFVFLELATRIIVNRKVQPGRSILSNWVVCQNFDLFARILFSLPEFWFVSHLFKNLGIIFCIQISLKIWKLNL